MDNEIIHIEVPAEVVKTTKKIDYRKRDDDLCFDYLKPMSYEELAKKYKISKVRVSQILVENKDFLSKYKEKAKLDRLHKWAVVKKKASEDIVPEDITDLATISKEERAELEPDKGTSINIDNRSLHLSGTPEELAHFDSMLARSLANQERLIAMKRQQLGVNSANSCIESSRASDSGVNSTSDTAIPRGGMQRVDEVASEAYRVRVLKELSNG